MALSHGCTHGRVQVCNDVPHLPSVSAVEPGTGSDWARAGRGALDSLLHTDVWLSLVVGVRFCSPPFATPRTLLLAALLRFLATSR